MTMPMYMWNINQMKRVASDGYVFEVMFRVSRGEATVDSLVLLKKSEELIPYESLTEDLVLSWIKQQLSDDTILTIEQQLNKNFEENPTPATELKPLTLLGLPW